MYKYTYIYITILFFRFFTIIGYYKILSIVLCAIEQGLIVYFIYSGVYMLIPKS